MEGPSSSITGTVAAGAYVMEVGAPAGTSIAAAAESGQSDPKALARALKRSGRERTRAVADAADDAVLEATDVTAEAEKAVELFNAVAQRKIEPAQLSGEIDTLLDLVERLDRQGRFDDVVRLGRALSGLLALTMRWLELARSLRTALRAAEAVGDDLAAAWAKHELGSLHLAAGDASAAERLLREAREARRRLDDRAGLSATEQNLGALCRQLRQLLREGRLVSTSRLVGRAWRYRAALAVAVGALAIAAAVASAVVAGDDPSTGNRVTAQGGNCEDGRDNDRDTFVDGDDPGCGDGTEAPVDVGPVRECANGGDDDGDGRVDRDDPGCGDGTEAPVDTRPVRDRDDDGVPDASDNCPAHVNPGQEDADGDDVGDACERSVD